MLQFANIGTILCSLEMSCTLAGQGGDGMRTYLIFIWHGIFLSFTMATIDFNTVFPSLITDLGGSKVIFGLLYSTLLGAPYLFNLLFGHYIHKHIFRRKFLLIGIYLRGLSFFGMAAVTYSLAVHAPRTVIASFFFWTFLFSVSGGFAGISYTDIIGKLVPPTERGKLYAAKQFTSSIAAFIGGLIVTGAFSTTNLPFPADYSLVLGMGGLGLVIAAIAFWFIREPPSPAVSDNQVSFWALLRQIPKMLGKNQEFMRFIIVQNLTSFSLMVMPFYMVFAKEHFRVADSYIGRYLLFQIAGAVLSNIVWGFISNKHGPKTVVRTCVALGGLIPLAAVGAAYIGPNAFAAVFFLVGFVRSGRQVGFDPYTLEIVPEKERPVYLGIQGTLNVLIVVMPFLGGVLIHLCGYYPVFILTATMMGLALALLVRDNSASATGC